MSAGMTRLRALALAMLTVFLAVAGFDQARSAAHPHEPAPLAGHHDAPPAGHHAETGAPCHGVLLCHAAVAGQLAVPGHAGPAGGIPRRLHDDLLPHLTHPAFDPPPPRRPV